ncbi:MAG TPA: NADPH:quinone oxidoreductase family protein [Polyangiaceae bacterium]|nr:NADPH:quinone oxidoreductase family protein [Polyangiaceae bacterium]
MPLAEGKRVVVSEFADNPAEAIDTVLSLQPMPAPDVHALKDTDVLVRVKSAAVGWVDLLMTSGQYQHMRTPPYTPGLEAAGEVAWVGSAVTGTQIGDAVIVDGFLAGPRSSGDYQQYGSFANYVVAPTEAIHPKPASLSFDQAAGLLSSYETAYHCLVTRGRLSHGEYVLIHGASGATGLAAVHVAKLLGATVIATGRNAAKLQSVREEGADHIVLTQDEAGQPRSFRDDVKALTDGKGVHVVYDAVGGDISIESMRCVGFGARFLIVGWAATPFVAAGKGKRGAPNANHLPTNLIMMKSLDVLGCPTVISTTKDPKSRAPRLKQVLAWAHAGTIVPRVSHVFPLSEYKASLRAKWSGQVTGGCVLRP